MATYKCCKCDNMLTPEGPVNALITHDRGVNARQILFYDNANIADHSLSEVLSLIPENSASVDIRIQEPVRGALANFTFQDLSLRIAPGPQQTVSQKLTICCQNCGACCGYDSQYAYNR